jgi:hypothetical protein
MRELEQSSHLQQQLLAPERGDDLHADREVRGLVVVNRDRDRRLTARDQRRGGSSLPVLQKPTAGAVAGSTPRLPCGGARHRNVSHEDLRS